MSTEVYEIHLQLTRAEVDLLQQCIGQDAGKRKEEMHDNIRGAKIGPSVEELYFRRQEIATLERIQTLILTQRKAQGGK